jgi:DNA-binding MarR family transcriptional regulator
MTDPTHTAPDRVAEVDNALRLCDRRGLTPLELRVLLALADRDGSPRQLAEALEAPSGEVRYAIRRLAARGLVRSRHAGVRGIRLAITEPGLATAGALFPRREVAR